ncbi:hypothetical protein HGRIS_013724 [Hohenbuehelia grisea]|uniref:Cerato-platanin n=1 Tax=Hohenbuehelia grisea TaxID=104357 RepID=A0ABR3IWQ0_9AGAR
MKFAILSLAALAPLAGAVSVAFDPVYGTSSNSLAIVACSDGQNGLLTQGFKTFGSLPTFPNIGGAPAVTGWNDADCGSCWEITFTNTKGVKKSLNITAVDVGGAGFVLSQQALDTLTGGQAVALGRVNATSRQVPDAGCRL